MSFNLIDLRCEFLCNPLGMDEPAPRFSWKLSDERPGICQEGYRIRVFSGCLYAGNGVMATPDPLWDSGRVESSESHLVAYRGAALEPHTRYYWSVQIWNNRGEASEELSAEDAALPWFETGFMTEDESAWNAVGAHWIREPEGSRERGETLYPSPYFRKIAAVKELPVEARLYITARGLYEAHINGMRVGCDVLVPGWTDYDRRIEYLAYDVTPLLQAGANQLEVALGDGWYAGNLGGDNFENHRNHWGICPELLLALRVVNADGSVQWICSDENWGVGVGPVRYADIYHGEYYDATIRPGQERLGMQASANGSEINDIASPDDNWKPVALSISTPVRINAKATPPIRAVEELSAVSVSSPASDCYVFDLGQNITGVVRLQLRGMPRGSRIVLRYAEMLQPDGMVYVENLRSARATDTYICCGDTHEIYEPRFTFHGFRYVEVTGLENAPSVDSLLGIVWQSDIPQTGTFYCSDPRVNQLQSNIRWGMRGNFLDVPTDCPQRDERLGWTGDAQIFAPTAAFNYDVATFFRKWCRDVADAQRPNGAYPDVAPDVFRFMFPNSAPDNSAWADAGVICPWLMYRHFGDLRILEENYPGMVRWIDHQLASSRNLIRPNIGYGDWLAPDAVQPSWAATPPDLIGTAYFAHTTLLMHKIAVLLGNAADATRFKALREDIVSAFNQVFVTTEGRIVGDSQTAYLIALAFDLVPEAIRPQCVAHLETCFARRNSHLSTGFVGTPLIGPVLSAVGRTSIAYDLLFQEDYPSWLFPVKNGATTMWERWNSWTPENGFGQVGMNSFNHYAYGAIGDWMYATIAGIALDPLVPAFKSFVLRPCLDARLQYAGGVLESPYGQIRSEWKRTAEGICWEVEVPPNTTARAYPPLPDGMTLDAVRIADAPWSEHRGVLEGDCGRSVWLQSGHYRIIIRTQADVCVVM